MRKGTQEEKSKQAEIMRQLSISWWRDSRPQMLRNVRSRLTKHLLAMVLICFACTPAWGEMWELPKGAPAPADVMCFDILGSRALVEELRDGDLAKKSVLGMKDVIQAKDQQIGAMKVQINKLETEADARREAMIRADEREKLRAEQVQLLKDIIAERKSLADDLRKDLAAERRKSTVNSILSTVLGAVIGWFTFGVIH